MNPFGRSRRGASTATSETRVVLVPMGKVALEGSLTIPDDARSVVLFAHGSGSSRHSIRNIFVAAHLNSAGFGSLLIDLLTPAEEAADADTRALRFDIGLLADRLVGAISWLTQQESTRGLSIGLFGASTGAAAALVAAARMPDPVGAVVSRGGRPDLAGDYLPNVKPPTLLIVGGEDRMVIQLNREAMADMTAPVRLEIVPGATHLFEEPGALEQVVQLARDWFARYLH